MYKEFNCITFLTELITTHLPNGRSVKLHEIFSVGMIFASGERGRVDVPAEFVTDFASVPRAFWSIIPPWGKYSPAAVIHDYLYLIGGMDRKTVDILFHDIMVHLKVPLWKYRVMYRMVRLFAWWQWRKYRKADKNRSSTN